MPIQTVFRRYEFKYLLTETERAAVLAALDGHMALDRYGRTTIRNLYLDTDSYRLIRASIEKPVYKEKLRLRSYRCVTSGDGVFVELKKKYKKVVYKRRAVMEEGAALDWICRGAPPPVEGQIGREIDYFSRFYAPLRPVCFLSYEREAYAPVDGGAPPEFRVTFDENILARTHDLTLAADVGGTALLPPGLCLMEIKTAGGIPLWMVDVLSRAEIRRASFSKYGTYYTDYLAPLRSNLTNERIIQ